MFLLYTQTNNEILSNDQKFGLFANILYVYATQLNLEMSSIDILFINFGMIMVELGNIKTTFFDVFTPLPL